MKRRRFITLLGGAAAASSATWPFAARAQQQSLPIRPLIGVMSPLSAAAATRNIAAFRSGLRDFGYLERRNATLELRYGDGTAERIALLVRELVALKPDVLFAGSIAGVLAAKDATRTIPIVTIISEDPVALGLANSIARPGGNVTGMWIAADDVLVGKRLEFLLLAVPGISRVGFLHSPSDRTDASMIPGLPAAAKVLGITVHPIDVLDVTTLDAVAAKIMRADVQALFVGQGPTLNSARVEITAMTTRLRLPTVYGFREFALAGGMMSYGPGLPDMYRQVARLVDRILKGANPGDLPFELPTRYELIVNLKTAKALGLAISDSFLLLADEVIE